VLSPTVWSPAVWSPTVWLCGTGTTPAGRLTATVTITVPDGWTMADVPSALPSGDAPPADGSLPPSALAGVGERPFGVYVHVPFCAARCGYCDFNTYTPGELGSAASPVSWLDAVRGELALAARVLRSSGAPLPTAGTMFVGGGTPSLLGASGLASVLDAVRSTFELAADAEVTTEANPESTSPEFFAGIHAAGFTRVSLGMQSAAPQVLAVLDRTHTPGRAVAAAREARAAGIEHVNLDLIYGTPGERPDDLRASLDAVLAAGADHVSAYALIVEDGTALAARVRHGELPAPDDDVLATRYELVDSVLSSAGFRWYEVSNWARSEAARCRHNLGYWLGQNWWGVGPGAHSHIGGVRWWNVKHPAAHAARLASGCSPAYAREVLSSSQWRLERVMLELRLSDGLPSSVLDACGVAAARTAAADGLLDPVALDRGRAVLTLRGRLLTDAVIRALVP
jgi:putative oxygen-independent coproporphyrinogen III oxidase